MPPKSKKLLNKNSKISDDESSLDNVSTSNDEFSDEEELDYFVNNKKNKIKTIDTKNTLKRTNKGKESDNDEESDKNDESDNDEESEEEDEEEEEENDNNANDINFDNNSENSDDDDDDNTSKKNKTNDDEEENNDNEYNDEDENMITGYDDDDDKKKSFSKDCYSKYVEQEDDFTDELIQDDNIMLATRTRISKPILTKYEMVRIIATRTTHLSMGAKPMIKNTGSLEPKEIAIQELRAGTIPLIIRRPIPNCEPEEWKITELEIIDDIFDET